MISIAIIGAGRLGTALGRTLAAHGYAVELVVARSLDSARRAAALIDPPPQFQALEDLTARPAARWLFLTTPDGALADTAAHLAALPAAAGPRRARIAWHTSGALASDILAPLQTAGYAVGSCHPLLSVSDAVTGAEALRRAFFCLEGEARAVSTARRLVKALGAQSFVLATRDKPLYHAAAVMACGHLLALFSLATDMLAQCGLPETTARTILLPLVQSTLDNLGRATPGAALTGPFARADAATIARHLSVLQNSGLPDALAAYLVLGRTSLDLARSRGAPAPVLDAIAHLLAQYAQPPHDAT